MANTKSLNIDQETKYLTNNQNFKKIRFDWKKRYWLWVPFILFSLIMVVIPLCFVLVITLVPVDNYTIADNWSILNTTIWGKIGQSIWISIVSTILCLLISYPFCYFLSQTKSKNLKKVIFSFATLPMMLGSLFILISLKSLLDKLNGAINSTFGPFFVIIGIIYLYIPFMFIPLYNSLETLPRNIVNASKDLGANMFVTFFKVIVPYSKQAIISGITLVLLPSISIVAVPQFLDNSPNSSLIGDIIMEQGTQALESKIALARACVLSVTISLLMFVIYILIVSAPKIYLKLKMHKSLKISKQNTKQSKGVKNE